MDAYDHNSVPATVQYDGVSTSGAIWRTDVKSVAIMYCLPSHGLQAQSKTSSEHVFEMMMLPCQVTQLQGCSEISTVSDFCDFYAPQLVPALPAGTAVARISYGNSVCPSVRLSVCLSVTTWWYTKPRRDRDFGSSPYDSLEPLVSNDVIWCRWVRRFPSNEGIKEGYPHLEIVILPLLAHLA